MQGILIITVLGSLLEIVRKAAGRMKVVVPRDSVDFIIGRSEANQGRRRGITRGLRWAELAESSREWPSPTDLGEGVGAEVGDPEVAAGVDRDGEGLVEVGVGRPACCRERVSDRRRLAAEPASSVMEEPK